MANLPVWEMYEDNGGGIRVYTFYEGDRLPVAGADNLQFLGRGDGRALIYAMDKEGAVEFVSGFADTVWANEISGLAESYVADCRLSMKIADSGDVYPSHMGPAARFIFDIQ